MSSSPAALLRRRDEPLQASFLELFFDLAFVLALRQLSLVLLADVSLAGAERRLAHLGRGQPAALDGDPGAGGHMAKVASSHRYAVDTRSRSVMTRKCLRVKRKAPTGIARVKPSPRTTKVSGTTRSPSPVSVTPRAPQASRIGPATPKRAKSARLPTNVRAKLCTAPPRPTSVLDTTPS